MDGERMSDHLQKSFPDMLTLLLSSRSGDSELRSGFGILPRPYSLDDFARVLAEADVLLVSEVYPAGEEPIRGADSRALCRAIRARGRVDPVLLESVDELPGALRDILLPGDAVLTLGAGNIGAVARELPARVLGGDE
jgi:UDP-N-acetylmuramate--alanine ligase